jgi:LacI family transcriptional regulator
MVIQETSTQPGRDKLRGIFRYVHLYGPWHVNLVQGRMGELRPETTADWNKYDGIIAGQMMLAMATSLATIKTPVVLMDPLDEALDSDSPFSKFSCTLDDSRQVGAAGADYLLERGHKTFAYVGEQLNRNWSVLRGQSFCQRIKKAGCECHTYSPITDINKPDADENCLIAWLKALPKPIAVMAAMDTRGHQIIDLCTDSGIRVPEDIAVLGIDNDELICNGSSPSLSSIRRDTDNCGFAAAEMLDQLIKKKTRKRKIVRYGACEVVTRDSSRRETHPANPVAAMAREFIRINIGEGIGVPDIVKHLNVSRRLAEMRFRSAYGHSLLDEIQSVRLDRVEKLLKETDLPLTEVCTRCGYQTDVHLRRIFKKHFGCSMRDYRQGACAEL